MDYWGEEDRNDPTISESWVDFTLMVHSNEVGDMRPATVEDLRRIGFMTKYEWEAL